MRICVETFQSKRKVVIRRYSLEYKKNIHRGVLLASFLLWFRQKPLFKIHKIEMYMWFFVITIFMENWSRSMYVIMCDFIKSYWVILTSLLMPKFFDIPLFCRSCNKSIQLQEEKQTHQNVHSSASNFDWRCEILARAS